MFIALAIILLVVGVLGVISVILGASLGTPPTSFEVVAVMGFFLCSAVFYGIGQSINRIAGYLADIRTVMKFIAVRDLPAGKDRDSLLALGNPTKEAAVRKARKQE